MAQCIGMIGSRRRNTDDDYSDCLSAFLDVYGSGDTLVSGGCPRGGDRFAERIARTFDVPITIHHPDWSKGRFAGLERNGLIARDADVLIAVVADDRRGGTEDTIRKYHALGKTDVILV